LRIQAADDGDVGEAEVAVADVAPQPGESLGKVYVRALRSRSWPARSPRGWSGRGELLVQALGFGGGTVLHDADGGEVREHRATMMSASTMGSA